QRGGESTRRYDSLACCSRTYRLDDLLAARRLELITARTSLNRLEESLIAVVRAEEDDSRFATSGADLLRGIGSGAIGQMKIDHGDIRADGAHRRDHLGDRRRNRHHHQIRVSPEQG